MPPQPAIPPVPQKQPEWFVRNWKWFVPLVIFVLLLFAGFIVGIIAAVFGVMRSSDVYKAAVARTNADPQVIAALGAPVREGKFFTGNINITNDTGHADFDIPVSGPHGSGALYVVADKSGGKWTFSTLTVEVAGSGQKIDITSDAQPAAAPER